MKANRDQLPLEAFWAINHSGGFTPEYARETLNHPHPYVRFWTIRLLGDGNLMNADLRAQLTALAARKKRRGSSCLAASCKRWPARCFPILAQLIRREGDVNDKHIPLLLWWALEDKSTSI